MFEAIVDPILSPLLKLNPLLGIAIISFILTLLMTIAYKYLTDQELMKSLKQEIKDFQKEMKEFKDNPTKVMEIQKKAMEKNMKYMMHSFKPMLFTFIPLVIMFGWLRNTYTIVPVKFLWFTSWFWIYIIFSVIFSMGLRKILKVH